MPLQTRFRFASAWLPEGWRKDVVITVDDKGEIVAISPDDSASPATRVAGAAIPGMPNVHSHAFQRAMAGRAECRAAGQDSFWTWRETMYELARQMTPQLLNAIAAQLYVEMLKAGYTSVCEFHYLHHRADGRPYADRGAMMQAIADAASTSGIGLTLLPTLYQSADFGGVAPTPRQRQFTLEVEQFIELWDAARSHRCANVNVGVALHSLRAVPEAQLRSVLQAVSSRDCNAIHIHVAEQQREVVASLEYSGRRPIEWLLELAAVDERWCLVHATHANDDELRAMAQAKVVVALCPTTEANLGDGLFPLIEYRALGGRMAIGSDSHVSVSPPEELRWLEYQARLARRARNVLAEGDDSSTGASLWKLACAGGAQASGRNIGQLAIGCRADIVVLDTDSPVLTCSRADELFDSLIFSGQPSPIRDVMVGGRWLVENGHHFAEEAVAAGYKRALRLLAG